MKVTKRAVAVGKFLKMSPDEVTDTLESALKNIRERLRKSDNPKVRLLADLDDDLLLEFCFSKEE